MKKILLILFILSGISSFSQEKRNCGANERLELYRKSHPESIKKSQVSRSSKTSVAVPEPVTLLRPTLEA